MKSRFSIQPIAVSGLGILAALVLLSAGPGDSQTIIQSISIPEASPVELTLFTLPAEQYGSEYKAFYERFDAEKNGEIIVIAMLRMKNKGLVPAETTIGEIVPLTGTKRHLIRAYIQENSRSAVSIYALPVLGNTIRVDAGKTVTLRLVFLVKKGDHANFEEALKIYACFTHPAIEGIRHSISISRRIDPDKPGGEPGGPQTNSVIPEPPPPPPKPPLLSEEINSISVRQLRYPMTAISPGGPSVFLEALIGKLGTDSKLPYWIGIAQAVESGEFDYYTAMQFLDTVAEYRERYPDKLARTTIWLQNQGIILAITEDGVYIAISGWEPLFVKHEVAEVILYIAFKAYSLGIDPTDTAPVPKSYQPVISPNPGEETGFEIDCTSGLHIRADGVGSSYNVQISKKEKDGASSWTKTLVYHRKAAD